MKQIWSTLVCILVSGPAVADGLRKEVGQIFAAEMISRSLSPKAARHFAECYEEGLVWSKLEQEMRRVAQGLPVVLYDREGFHRLDCVWQRMRRWPKSHPVQPMRVVPQPGTPRAILLEAMAGKIQTISFRHDQLPIKVSRTAGACYLDRFSNAKLAQILRLPRTDWLDAIWERPGRSVTMADLCSAIIFKCWDDAVSERYATQGGLDK